MREEKKNDVDDRGSVHPSGNEIKVVIETRSKQQAKISWDLDEQAIQLGRNSRKHYATAEGRMGWECGAAWSPEAMAVAVAVADSS